MNLGLISIVAEKIKDFDSDFYTNSYSCKGCGRMIKNDKYMHENVFWHFCEKLNKD